MKKRFIYLMLAAFLLAGCGKSTSTTVSTNESADKESVALESKAEEVEKGIIKNDVQMLDVHIFYKVREGFSLLEGMMPQVEVKGNDNLKSIIEKINNQWTDEHSSIELTRADSNIFSLFIKTMVYSDYDKNGEEIRGINIDSNTGKELKISDVLKNPVGLYDKLTESEEFMEEYGADIAYFSEKLESVLTKPQEFSDGTNNDSDIAWALNNGGMMIYMIKENDYGKEIVSIPLEYARYSEFFKDDVLKLPDDYAFKILPDREIRFNIDGKERALELTQEINEYDIAQEIRVKIDGEKRTYQDGSSYGISKSYVLKKGDHAYLYVELTYDNDYKSMMIIDLNKKSETISIGDSFAHTALLNPNDFYLGDNIFTISSVWVERKYELVDDGRPKALTDYFTITTPVQLAAKIELNGEMLDGVNGNSLGSINLPVGILLTPVGTDKESFTDYTMSDGSIVRIPMEKISDYEIKIDGKPVDEVFDGTFFAG